MAKLPSPLSPARQQHHQQHQRDSDDSADADSRPQFPARPTSHARTPSSSSSSSSHPNAPPVARPPLRSNFDLEPNPFEQSFSYSSTSLPSVRSAPSPTGDAKKSPTSSTHSSGSHSRKASLSNVPSVQQHGANGNGHQTPKPMLPPLASITSPSDPSYAWSFSSAGLTNSLRSGPLSPAMLAGPQTQPPVSIAQPASSIAALASSAASVHPPIFGFDASGTFRTGLTPSTGLTPLVGGPVSFPPPSPNTAAFLAMVNQGANSSAATITPNTLNAITGVLAQHTANQQQQQQQQQAQSNPPMSNGSNGSSQAPPATSIAPSQMSVASYGSNNERYGIHVDTFSAAYSPVDDSDSFQSAQSATNHAANGLFLLSQAHQELAKREEAQKQSLAHANVNGIGNGQQQTNGSQDESASAANNKRGSKRKTEAGNVSSSTASTTKPTGAKRTRTASSAITNTRSVAARRSSTTASLEDDDFDDSDDENAAEDALAPQSGSTKGGPKKPETEEEKRRNFLERNRQAALKCRQRKKAWLSQLQARVEFLANENERLTAALVSSREEISRLSQLVGGAGVTLPLAAAVGVPHHAGIGIGGIQQQHQQQTPYMAQAHHPVSVPVSLAAQGAQAGSPPMPSKVPPQMAQHQSPHSPTSEGRSSRSSIRGEYASVRTDSSNARDHYVREAKREMNGHHLQGHAQQAVTVNGRGYGY